MKTVIYITVIIAALASVAYAGWRFRFRDEPDESIVLHGNVDLRQVDLPFNGQQRVAAVFVEEGDRVGRGQVVARLETDRLEAAVAEAAARAEAQRRVVERLDAGTRPEEIEQANARVAAAEADVARTKAEYDRLKALTGTGATSTKEIDESRSAFDSAAATLRLHQKALDLAVAGPRAEDRAEARATLAALEAQLTLRRRELADAELRSPVAGVVRNRILEPGEMSAPGAAAMTIAVTDPKWVRAYANERDLGKVRPGAPAAIAVDAYPGQEFDGWVGFVSPVAEFTPKSVETAELRTALMYEVRVYFRDPADELRLGMPATVHLRPARPTGQPTAAGIPETQPTN